MTQIAVLSYTLTYNLTYESYLRMTTRAELELLLETKKEMLENVLEDIRVIEVKLATKPTCGCYCNCKLLEWDNRHKTHHEEKCGMSSCKGATCVRKEKDVPTFCTSECCTTKNCICECMDCANEACVCKCHTYCTECKKEDCGCDYDCE